MFSTRSVTGRSPPIALWCRMFWLWQMKIANDVCIFPILPVNVPRSYIRIKIFYKPRGNNICTTNYFANYITVYVYNTPISQEWESFLLNIVQETHLAAQVPVTATKDSVTEDYRPPLPPVRIFPFKNQYKPLINSGKIVRGRPNYSLLAWNLFDQEKTLHMILSL